MPCCSNLIYLIMWTPGTLATGLGQALKAIKNIRKDTFV